MAVIERLDATAREEWDTDTRTYRRWADGQLVEERPFTDVEGACSSIASGSPWPRTPRISTR
jgi:hypothetical protein